MNEARVEVYGYAVVDEDRCGQLCPLIGVVTVVMANDNPTRARILHIVKDVGTQPLVNI